MASLLRELIATFMHCSAAKAIMRLTCAVEETATGLFLAVVVVASIELLPVAARVLTVFLLSTALLVGLSQLRRHDHVVLIAAFWLRFVPCMIAARL